MNLIILPRKMKFRGSEEEGRRKEVTREQYYELLKKKHKETDWTDLQSIRNYNEYARQLRKEMEELS